MLIKDIIKEKWLQVANEKELEKEISQEELDMLVYEAYKNSVKYGNKNNVNKPLAVKFEKLNDRTKHIKTIKNISILRNVKMENRNENYDKSYLVMEDDKGIALLLDIKRGYDESFNFDKSIALCQHSKIETIFEYANPTANVDIDIGHVKDVVYYENAILENTFSNIDVSSPFILRICDKFNTIIYLDILSRNIFIDRNNYKLITNNKSKTISIFQNGKETLLKNKVLSHIKLRLIDLLYEWGD